MRNYIKGMLIGWALFAVLFVVGYAYVSGNGFPSWMPGRVGFVAAIVAMPIGFGGWVFVWGDGAGQPPSFVNTLWFSVASGLILYGVLGAITGAVYGRLRRRTSATTAARAS